MQVLEKGVVPWDGKEATCGECDSHVLLNSNDKPITAKNSGMGTIHRRKYTFTCPVCHLDEVELVVAKD